MITVLIQSCNVSWMEVRFNNVRFEVFTAVTMKNGVFWVVTPCGSEEPGASFIRVTKIGELDFFAAYVGC
jgi:hypothetical protein